MYTSIREQNFFLKHLEQSHRVLEWGSGQSTLEIAERVKSLVSIEHNRPWYDKTINKIPNNAKLILKEPNGPWDWGRPQPYELFKDYIEYPLQEIKDGLFDIVFIDGTSRQNCASICKQITHENSIVFIHDFDLKVRTSYIDALKYLEKIEQVETMAKFKVIR